MSLNSVKIKKICAIHDDILVTGMNFSERTTKGGILLAGDDGKTHGIRPRWAKVYAIGPDQTDVEIGDWICIEHGRWSRAYPISDETGEHQLQKADPNAILLVSKEEPIDDFITEVNY